MHHFDHVVVDHIVAVVDLHNSLHDLVDWKHHIDHKFDLVVHERIRLVVVVRMNLVFVVRQIVATHILVVDHIEVVEGIDLGRCNLVRNSIVGYILADADILDHSLVGHNLDCCSSTYWMFVVRECVKRGK